MCLNIVYVFKQGFAACLLPPQRAEGFPNSTRGPSVVAPLFLSFVKAPPDQSEP
jgi:hypothetical protein